LLSGIAVLFLFPWAFALIFGHFYKMDPDRLPETSFFWEPAGTLERFDPCDRILRYEGRLFGCDAVKLILDLSLRSVATTGIPLAGYSKRW
jgi:hypothetical protein